jgi:hypothetical protein
VQERDVETAVQVLPPGFDVTEYELMAEPPVSEGAAQLKVTVPLPKVPTVGLPGAPGLVAGVTVADVAALEEPSEFCAVTAKV